MFQSISRRCFLGAAAGAFAPLIAQPARTRNVLFIASDDLNHCMSTYGHPVVQTPNIDRIARDGVRFDRAYCQFPLCSPSRSSLFTGLAPDATGVHDLQRHFREKLPDVVTLPQLFQKNGAFAARVGKMFHYGNPGQIGTDGLDDPPSWNAKVNPKGVDKAEEPKLINYTPGRGLGAALCFYASPAKDEEHTDGMVAAETIRLMQENRARSWFLGAGFYRPHCPYIAPTKYFDRVPLDRVKLVPFEDWEMSIAPRWAYSTRPAHWGLTEKQRLEVMQAYYASILFLDAQVGRLLDALDRLRLADRTTVVFWSDHGYQLGEHGQWMKQTLFEPSARTPLLISGAGVKSRGKSCARTVELLDLYPTIAEICGLRQTPANLHGVSLAPLLASPSRARNRPAVTQVLRPNQGRPVIGYSLRDERYRYTMWNSGSEGEELYDYESDPREMKNLAGVAERNEVKTGLRAQLDSIVEARRRTG